MQEVPVQNKALVVGMLTLVKKFSTGMLVLMVHGLEFPN